MEDNLISNTICSVEMNALSRPSIMDERVNSGLLCLPAAAMRRAGSHSRILNSTLVIGKFDANTCYVNAR